MYTHTHTHTHTHAHTHTHKYTHMNIHRLNPPTHPLPPASQTTFRVVQNSTRGGEGLGAQCIRVAASVSKHAD
jgi:hypothetical protein